LIHHKAILTSISEYRERRDTLVTELNKVEVKLANPKTFYCIAEFLLITQTFFTMVLGKLRYNGETVLVAPAAGFYSTPGVGLKSSTIYVEGRLDQTVKFKRSNCGTNK
jgi:aspartate aminotransferase